MTLFDAAHSVIMQLVEITQRQAQQISALEARVTALETSVPAPSGIWLSRDEIMALPTNGTAWEQVNTAAHSTWGTADLGNNESQHDVKTLAGALVAIRLEDAVMREKVIAALHSATQSRLSRVLELARGLQTYIIVADLLDYHDSDFMAWVAAMVITPLQGHSGGTNLLETALFSPNNWGDHARASLAAAALYLKRQDWQQIVVDAHREFVGEDVLAPHLVYTTTNWHPDSDDRVGINRRGAVIQGNHVSGTIPEDARRGGEFQWPPVPTTYEWEALQGIVVCAALLHRAGLVPFNAGDNAVVRAVQFLYGEGEAAQNIPVFQLPASGDDCWVTPLVNAYGGVSLPVTLGTPGKGMAWCNWTHA